MNGSVIIIAVGLLIFYVLFDFLIIGGADINKFGNKWVQRLIWLWLPIYALQRLIKEVIFKK